MTERHPTTATWQFPPESRASLGEGIERTNLRELVARPRRFEHHLVVVGSVGDVQLEVVTASEPLYFTHQNISDEYAVALLTGDLAIDSFPVRTFVSDVSSGEHVARIRHRAGQMLLHPYGYLHWPGQLRPPYQPMAFAAGTRRTGVSLVVCAAKAMPPPERPLFISEGLEADAKLYGEQVPLLLADLAEEPSRTIGAMGEATLELLVKPKRVEAERGAYLAVLTGSEPHFDCDLIYLSPGAVLDGAGLERALLLSSPSRRAWPPPESWRSVPEPPFAVFEDGAAGALPIAYDALRVEDQSAELVAVALAGERREVPRYWLARMLFRIALHQYAIGYLETYGGFFYDDRDGFRLGLRGVGAISLDRDGIEEAIETLYRAVAPEGYVERLS
jgi:hypothetical protein